MLTGEDQIKLLDFGLAKLHHASTTLHDRTATDARMTGRPAFRADTKLSTLAAILKEEPQPLREVTPEFSVELETVIARCLRKDPGMRWQHMADLRVALEELRKRQDSAPSLPGLPASARGRWVLWSAPVLAAAAVASWILWPKTLPLSS